MSIDTALEAVRSAVDDVPEKRRNGGAEVLDLASRAADEAKARLSGVDPLLLTPNMTQRLNDALNAVAQQVHQQSAAEDGSFSWDPVRNAVAVVLDALPTLPPARSQDVEVVAAREHVERLAARGREIDETLARTTDRVTADLQSLSQTINTMREQQEARDAELRQQQDTRDAELKQRIDDLVVVVDTQKATLSDALDKQQAGFRAEQDQRRNDHQQSLQEEKKTTESAVAEFREEAQADRKKVEAKTNDHLDTLKRFLDEARQVHGALGRTAMAAGYQEEAAEEERDADRFRTYTLRLGLGAVAILVALVFVAALGAGVSVVLAKLATSTALGGLATYTARQSSSHRSTARRLRGTYLAIASLGPYLATIVDETARDQVIRTFAYIFFAVPHEGETPEESLQAVQTLIGLAQQFTQSGPKA